MLAIVLGRRTISGPLVQVEQQVSNPASGMRDLSLPIDGQNRRDEIGGGQGRRPLPQIHY